MVLLALLPSYFAISYIFFQLGFNKEYQHYHAKYKMTKMHFPWEGTFGGKVFRLARILFACWIAVIGYAIIGSEILLFANMEEYVGPFFKNYYGYITVVAVFGMLLKKFLR